MFKVVADQLKVSDGWVRCGHCDGVFDASAHFQAIAEPEIPQLPEEEFQEPHSPAPAVFSVVDDMPGGVLNPLVSDVDKQTEQAHQTSPPARPEVPVDDASVSAPLSSYLSAPETPDFSVQADQARSQDATDRRVQYGSTKSNKPVHSVKAEDTRRQPLPEVTFVQSAKRRDKPTSPFYRGLWVLVAMALLVALALQVLFHDRDAWAARYPALLPTLETLCQKMDCQINAPRVIEAIAIDSSSFTQTGPDAYRLNVVLKNTRLAAVAMPALEVTLTGSQNEVLMRKVLLPAEFGATRNRLESAVPFAGVLTLLVSPPPVLVQPSQSASSAEAAADVPPVAGAPAASAPITGYRLFAFYP